MWKTPFSIEDNDGRNAHSPVLAISGNDVVAVWIQESDGTSEAGIQGGGYSYAVYSNYATFSGSNFITALEEGGNCFIATAAFGSPLAGQVEILRQFRDKYLLTNELGRKFVAWYYQNGPAAAAFITDKPMAKLAVQAALYPLIGFSFVLLNGFMPFVLMGLVLAGLVFFRFRMKKADAA